MHWVNFFHIYQPPNWPPRIIKKVANQSYRPFLKILEQHRNLKITLNISGSLTEQLAQHKLTDIIQGIKKLASRKQIELVGTAIYHPLLPLVPEKEIIRQVKLNNSVNKKYFGQVYNPKGFFPPEMAYSRQLADIVYKLGFKWIIIDEISKNGKLGELPFKWQYSIKNSGLKVVFRNRNISDYISFRSKLQNPQDFWQEIMRDNRSQHSLVTAMDGENLGHHRQDLDKYWKKIVTKKNITTITVSEFLKKFKDTRSINPKKASWSSREKELKNRNPYVLWLDTKNPIHHLQWKLLHRTINLVNKNKRHKKYQQARLLLDKRLASDQFWWASAKPWWSLQIIKKKTKELHQIALLLNDKTANQMVKRIIGFAQNWQKTKKFQKISNQYLASLKVSRYIGGKKLT